MIYEDSEYEKFTSKFIGKGSKFTFVNHQERPVFQM